MPSDGPGAGGDALRFAGGWALFLGYELASEIEPQLALPRTPLPWQAFALRTPCALVHDLRRRRVCIVAEAQASYRKLIAQKVRDGYIVVLPEREFQLVEGKSAKFWAFQPPR